jgi:hypothetical protein
LLLREVREDKIFHYHSYNRHKNKRSMSEEPDNWGVVLAPRGVAMIGRRITFDHITTESFQRCKSYQESHRLRWKCHYYPNLQQLQLTTPSCGHEATSSAISGIIHNWNLTNFPLYAGIPGAGPLKDFRSADIKQTNFQGDSLWVVVGRATGNIVLEVGNSEDAVAIIDDCKAYMALTQDIMLSVGVKYWKRGTHEAAMAICVWEREAVANNPTRPFNRAVLRQRISFGTHMIPPDAFVTVSSKIATNSFVGDGVAAHPWTGVGIAGGVPCNAAGIPAYQVILPARFLLCLDNLGIVGVSPFYNNIVGVGGGAMPPDVVVDLFLLQQQMLEGIIQDN